MAHIKAKYKINFSELKKRVRNLLKKEDIDVYHLYKNHFEVGDFEVGGFIISGIIKRLSEYEKEPVYASDGEIRMVLLKIFEEEKRR